jgi:hypothetical protein
VLLLNGLLVGPKLMIRMLIVGYQCSTAQRTLETGLFSNRFRTMRNAQICFALFIVECLSWVINPLRAAGQRCPDYIRELPSWAAF